MRYEEHSLRLFSLQKLYVKLTCTHGTLNQYFPGLIRPKTDCWSIFILKHNICAGKSLWCLGTKISIIFFYVWFRNAEIILRFLFYCTQCWLRSLFPKKDSAIKMYRFLMVIFEVPTKWCCMYHFILVTLFWKLISGFTNECWAPPYIVKPYHSLTEN